MDGYGKENGVWPGFLGFFFLGFSSQLQPFPAFELPGFRRPRAFLYAKIRASNAVIMGIEILPLYAWLFAQSVVFRCSW